MIAALVKVLDYADRVVNLILERLAQNERDKLEKDPAKWFAEHFNGGVPGNASEADKTDTGADHNEKHDVPKK